MDQVAVHVCTDTLRRVGADIRGDLMPRRTPIERAIAQRGDRRLKYDQAQRDAGLVRASVWIPADARGDFLLLAKILCATNGKYRERLSRFVHGEARGHWDK